MSKRVSAKRVLEVYPLSGCYKIIIKKDGKCTKEFWKIEKLLKKYLNKDNKENFKFTKDAHKDMSRNIFTSSILVTNVKTEMKKKDIQITKGSFLHRQTHYEMTLMENGIETKKNLFETDLIKWFNSIETNIIFAGVKKPHVLDIYGNSKFIDKFT